MRFGIASAAVMSVIVSGSCSDAPQTAAPTREENPIVVEMPKFAPPVPAPLPKPVPKATAPAASGPLPAVPSGTLAVAALPTGTAPIAAATPIATPTDSGMRATVIMADGVRVTVPTVAEGFPVRTMPGQDDRSVTLLRPDTEERLVFPISESGGMREITVGASKIRVLRAWTPGMDLFLSPKQMIEVFPPSGPAAPQASAFDPTSIKVTTPDRVVPLVGTLLRAAVGGRHLVLSMLNPSRFAIYQAGDLRADKALSLDVRLYDIAAGSERFFLYDRVKRTVTHRSYADVNEKEDSHAVNFEYPEVFYMGVGRNSNGPLLFNAAGTQLRLIRTDTWQGYVAGRTSQYATVSVRDDGQAVYSSTGDGRTNEVQIISRRSKSDPKHVTTYPRDVLIATAKENAAYRTDGTGLYLYAKRELLFRNGLRVGNPSRFDTIIPCSPPGFWLAVGQPSPSIVGMELYCGADSVPLETMYFDIGDKKYEGVNEPPLQGRVAFFPHDKTLALVATNPARIIMKKLDPEELLRASGRPMLMVASTPPSAPIPREEPFEYQIRVVSSSDKVSYEVVEAPPGLTCSPEGLVRWEPVNSPGKPPGFKIEALIKISSATGKTAYERIDLTIQQ